MRQKLFTIPIFGGIDIYTYGTLIVVGFLVGAWWTRRAAQKRLGIDPERTFNVGFAILFLGLLGARLAYAIAHYDEFTRTPLKLLKIWEGGLSFQGGVIGAILFALWFLRARRLSFWPLADIVMARRRPGTRHGLDDRVTSHLASVFPLDCDPGDDDDERTGFPRAHAGGPGASGRDRPLSLRWADAAHRARSAQRPGCRRPPRFT